MARMRLRKHATRIITVATEGGQPDPWLLPDDDLGELDEFAIKLAVNGVRPVRLTADERLAAAMAILQNKGTVRDVCQRLNLPIILEDLCPTKTPPSVGKNSQGFAA